MNNMTILDAPPAIDTGRRKAAFRFADEAEVLRQVPGKWGLLLSGVLVYNYISSLRNGQYRVFSDIENWDFVVRDSYIGENGRRYGDIWASFQSGVEK